MNMNTGRKHFAYKTFANICFSVLKIAAGNAFAREQLIFITFVQSQNWTLCGIYMYVKSFI